MIKRQRLRRARRVEELPPMNCPAVDNLPRVAVGRQRHARHTEEVALHMERPAEAAGEERATEKQRAQPERKPARRIHEQEAQQQRQPEDDERLDLRSEEFRRRQQRSEQTGEHGKPEWPKNVRSANASVRSIFLAEGWGCGCGRPRSTALPQPASGHQRERILHD